MVSARSSFEALKIPSSGEYFGPNLPDKKRNMARHSHTSCSGAFHDGDRADDVAIVKLIVSIWSVISLFEEMQEAAQRDCVGLEFGIDCLRCPEHMDDKDSHGCVMQLCFQERTPNCGEELIRKLRDDIGEQEAFVVSESGYCRSGG
jgi:hypothetical protein